MNQLKTPLRISREDPGIVTWLVDAGGKPLSSGAFKVDHARQIIQAVNAHAALVEALEQVRDFHQQRGIPQDASHAANSMAEIARTTLDRFKATDPEPMQMLLAAEAYEAIQTQLGGSKEGD